MKDSFEQYETLDCCPVCGGSVTAPAYATDVVRCGACRVLFRNPRPTQGEIIASYDRGSTYREWERDDAAFKDLWTRRVRLVRRFRAAGELLDIGAGDGRFLELAGQSGFAITGTEVSAEGIARAGRRGVRLLQGQVLDINLAGRSFDVITMWHVLEHLPNPGEVLAAVCGWLKPGGILIAAVPNESNAIWKSRLRWWSHDEPFRPLVPEQEIHLTCFEPRTFQRALENAGLSIMAFMVDDYYPAPSLFKKVKVRFYGALAFLTRWHPAAAMTAVCCRGK